MVLLVGLFEDLASDVDLERGGQTVILHCVMLSVECFLRKG